MYDGDGSDTELAGPPGSAQIEEIFTEHFADAGLASEPSPFNGRSDYGPFIAVGIPAGGLFSGAEGVKTEEQAAVYGGTAGVAYDPCYHQACDTINNLNTTALSQMGDAAADAVVDAGEVEDRLLRRRQLQAPGHRRRGRDRTVGAAAALTSTQAAAPFSAC